MPTYKHPCPYCGKFIDKVVAACPYCAHPDPFAPKRCPNCRKIIDDPEWKACPSCGASLVVVVTTVPEGAAAPSAPAPAAGTSAAPAEAPAQAAAPPPAAPPPAAPAEPAKPAEPAAPVDGPKCTGCGSPLSAGARFCTVCGTMAG